MWHAAIENHGAIYKALVAGDEERAARAVASHADQMKSQLRDIMKKLRSDSFFQEEQ